MRVAISKLTDACFNFTVRISNLTAACFNFTEAHTNIYPAHAKIYRRILTVYLDIFIPKSNELCALETVPLRLVPYCAPIPEAKPQGVISNAVRNLSYCKT